MAERLLSEVAEMLLALAVMLPILAGLTFYATDNNIETNTLMNTIQYTQGAIGSGEDSQVIITLDNRGHTIQKEEEKITLITEKYELEESIVGRDVEVRQTGEAIVIEVS